MVLGAGGAAWQSPAPAPCPAGWELKLSGTTHVQGLGCGKTWLEDPSRINVDGARKTMIWKAGLESGIRVSGFSQGGRRLAKLS